MFEGIPKPIGTPHLSNKAEVDNYLDGPPPRMPVCVLSPTCRVLLTLVSVSVRVLLLTFDLLLVFILTNISF